MKYRIDIVTVYHNDHNYDLLLEQRAALAKHEPDGGYRHIGVDNRTKNRGFAAGCNLGASHATASAPIIGFINPDAVIEGPFISTVCRTIKSPVVITGCRYDKPAKELAIWGVNDWVCGATLFVDRKWFESIGGFDEQFVWSWEETDLIRTAESHGLECRSVDLPITHASPGDDSPADSQYKAFHFTQSQRRFARKWGKTS